MMSDPTAELEENRLITAYLVGQLSDAEADAFEERIAQDPAVYRRVESVLRLKEGLAVLEERGAIATLLQPSRRRWRWLIGIAALLLIAAGIWSWRSNMSSSRGVLARAVAELNLPTTGAVIEARYVWAHTRGGDAQEVVVKRNVEIAQIKLLPADLAANHAYRVTLERLEPASGSSLEALDALAGGDGYVTVYLAASRMRPGIYEMSIASSGASESEKFQFRIE
jgi:anti-sigma factor RsiW